MTIREQIVELMTKNPGKTYTAKEIEQITKGREKNVQKAIRALIEKGVLMKNKNPAAPKSPKYGLSETYCGPTVDLPETYCGPTIFRSLIITYNNIKDIKENIRNKEIRNKELLVSGFHPTPSTEPEPDSVGVLDAKRSLLKFIFSLSIPLAGDVPGFAGTEPFDIDKIVENVSDDLWLKITTLAENFITEINPIFEPVLKSVYPTLVPPSDGPVVRTPVPKIPAPDSPVVASARKRLAEEDAKKAAKRTLKPKAAKSETPYTKTKSKTLAEKEALITSAPTTPHVRYYRLSPDERTLEFAKAYVKTTQTHFAGWKLNAGWARALTGLRGLREAETFYGQIRRARIEADLLGARYDDYMIAAVEYQHKLNKDSSVERAPAPKDLAGENHVEFAKDYIQLNLKTRVLISRKDVQNNQNANHLLPENYETGTPEQRQEAEIFYQDVVFPELEKVAHHSPRYNIQSMASRAIEYGLIPQQWAEGYRIHHRIEKLRGFKYAKPECFDGAIFREVHDDSLSRG